MRQKIARTAGLLIALGAAGAGCADRSSLLSPSEPSLDNDKVWEVTASTRWNTRATDLIVLRPPANGQAATARILTYLSIAQYRAALTAEDFKQQSVHASVSAAVGAASATVLSAFFPLDATSIEAQLTSDLASPTWPGAKHEHVASGVTIGRQIGSSILAKAASDNYLVASPGSPPVGPGRWVSSGAPLVRAMYGARPFFMASTSELRSPPPPAVGSAEFLAALAEVRQIADTRTPNQVASAQFWNTATGPFTAGALNRTVTDLLVKHKRSERESARVLAYANAAVFDAMIACFDTKYAYWYPRPTHADPAISLAIALPNHPSYPSAHSCIASALLHVAAVALPSERASLMAMVEESGRSRVLGGIHYQFDIHAGQEIGRRAAALALAGSLE